jgi:hypothetical protein
VRPIQDDIVGLAGERAGPDLRVRNTEEPAAASIEREWVRFAEVLLVILGELAGGVQANLIQHPPEINQAPDFIVATAQAWNIWHRNKDNQGGGELRGREFPVWRPRRNASSFPAPGSQLNGQELHIRPSPALSHGFLRLSDIMIGA